MFEIDSLEPGRLPEGLAEMAPDAELATLLETVDRGRLSGFDRVLVMQANTRLVSHFQAALYADMVAVADSTSELMRDQFDLSEIEDSAAMEIRAALDLTRRAAESQLEFARLVCERLPQVWVALDAGWIDTPRARVIVDQTLHLEEPLARAVAEEVLGPAGSMTTGQLRARVARLAISVDPAAAKTRYEEGLEERRVSAVANPDGTANLYGLHLPADLTHATLRRINRLARAAKTKDDPRTMDQIRADVFLDILAGGSGKDGTDRAVVDIRVDLTTLGGVNDDPGLIPGWGPVIADVARRLVDEQPEAEHRITVSGERGEPLWTGITRRRPTKTQQRQVTARNPNCVFPGCRVPAADCDIDHHKEWARNGPTEDWNIGPLCRRDHIGRHRGWHLVQIRPGTYQWTSPLQHTYIVEPDPP